MKRMNCVGIVCGKGEDDDHEVETWVVWEQLSAKDAIIWSLKEFGISVAV